MVTDIDKIIVTLASVVTRAGRQDQSFCQVYLGNMLAILGEIPDVASDGAMAWMEVQRQASLAITALDSCRRPPTERPVRKEELVADARERAIRCIRAAHELSCGRLM